MPQHSERITKLAWDQHWGLVAATVEGSLIVFDDGLSFSRRIPVPDLGAQPAARSIYGLAVSGDRAYTRNKRGTFAVTDLRTGRVEAVLPAEAVAAKHRLMPGEEPSPTIVRGVGVTEDHAYYSNGFFQLTRVDLTTLRPEVIEDVLLDRRIDSFSFDGPLDVVSDREGCLSFADLAKPTIKFEVRVDGGNVHKAVWDGVNRCYWATLDAGTGEHAFRNGIAKVSLDGEVLATWLGARNDMETIVLSTDRRRMAFGGFDNALYLMATDDAKLSPDRVVTGFSHQIIDAVVTRDDTIVVLSQDGELVELTWDGVLKNRSAFERSCVWDIKVVAGGDELAIATDSGVEFRDVAPTSGQVSRVTRKVPTRGFVRRLTPLPDGDLLAVLWHETVERRTRSGRVVWTTNLDKPVYEACVVDGVAYVGTFEGVEVLDCTDGRRVRTVELDGLPIWALTVDEHSNTLYAASRTGQVFHVDLADEGVTSVGDIGGYPKRALWLADRVVFTGGGGVRTYDPGSGQVVTTYKEYLDNTAENAALLGDHVVCVSYGMQVGVYRAADAEPVALDESLPDFTKAIARLDDTHFVVGGRSGYLRVYELQVDPDGTVHLGVVAEHYVETSVPTLKLRVSTP